MSHWITGTIEIEMTVDEFEDAARECGLQVESRRGRGRESVVVDRYITVWKEGGKVKFGADSDYMRDARGYLQRKGVFAMVTKNKIMAMAPKGTKWKVEQEGEEIVMVGFAASGGSGFKKGGWS